MQPQISLPPNTPLHLSARRVARALHWRFEISRREATSRTEFTTDAMANSMFEEAPSAPPPLGAEAPCRSTETLTMLLSRKNWNRKARIGDQSSADSSANLRRKQSGVLTVPFEPFRVLQSSIIQQRWNNQSL